MHLFTFLVQFSFWSSKISHKVRTKENQLYILTCSFAVSLDICADCWQILNSWLINDDCPFVATLHFNRMTWDYLSQETNKTNEARRGFCQSWIYQMLCIAGLFVCSQASQFIHPFNSDKSSLCYHVPVQCTGPKHPITFPFHCAQCHSVATVAQHHYQKVTLQLNPSHATKCKLTQLAQHVGAYQRPLTSFSLRHEEN